MLEKLRKRIRDRIYCYLPLEDYYGRDFKRINAFLHDSRNWDRERMEAFKLDRLRSLLQHAQEFVPYYREQYRELGFDYRDIKTFGDFAQLPILNKETLRNELDRLKADDFDSYRPLYTKTSGTTAGQTLLYRSKYQEDFRKAVVWRFYLQFGHKPGDRWVNIACRNFDPDSPVAEFNRIEKCLVINTFHIVRGNREEIIEAIRNFRPNMIWTHPSPLGILAEYAISKGIAPIKVPLVATYAEKMYPHIRKAVTRFFPARYIEYYANRENSFASWGESDDRFHEISEYCHMEVANRGTDGETGDLISTNLHNYAVPLIRYDPGDLVRWIGFPDDTLLSGVHRHREV
jgi:phenylacetate-CoA ligase